MRRRLSETTGWPNTAMHRPYCLWTIPPKGARRPAPWQHPSTPCTDEKRTGPQLGATLCIRLLSPRPHDFLYACAGSGRAAGLSKLASIPGRFCARFGGKGILFLGGCRDTLRPRIFFCRCHQPLGHKYEPLHLGICQAGQTLAPSRPQLKGFSRNWEEPRFDTTKPFCRECRYCKRVHKPNSHHSNPRVLRPAQKKP